MLVTDFVKYLDPKNYKGFRNIKSPTEQTKEVCFDSKESDALHQLQDTLESLCNVASIKAKFDACPQKLCVFSNRVKPVEAPLGMTNGFNLTFETMIQKAISFSYDDINKFGFEYYCANLIELSDTVSPEDSK